MNKLFPIAFLGISAILFTIALSFKISIIEEGKKQGAFKYKDFQKPEYCQSCHNQFYQQWSQAMMSQAYTHEWDEIEYFKLAVPHSEADPAMAGVHDG